MTRDELVEAFRQVDRTIKRLHDVYAFPGTTMILELSEARAALLRIAEAWPAEYTTGMDEKPLVSYWSRKAILAELKEKP